VYFKVVTCPSVRRDRIGDGARVVFFLLRVLEALVAKGWGILARRFALAEQREKGGLVACQLAPESGCHASTGPDFQSVAVARDGEPVAAHVREQLSGVPWHLQISAAPSSSTSGLGAANSLAGAGACAVSASGRAGASSSTDKSTVNFTASFGAGGREA